MRTPGEILAGCFNPRPREGATSYRAVAMSVVARFQSTPPRRGDSRAAVAVMLSERVSIHAPAKGRRRTPPCTAGSGSFNPRPREGATPSSAMRSVASLWFQSTPPRRGDLVPLILTTPHVEFQSTPPRRGDVTVATLVQ